VLCEKPMTMTVEEGEDIVRTAKATGKICAVNYGYTAYPMVRHMKAMVARGDLGAIRLVKADFSHGHHADAAMMPTIRGCAGATIRRRPASRADGRLRHPRAASGELRHRPGGRKAVGRFRLLHCGRELEDDAMVNFRTAKGTVGRLWTSSIAIGRQHGLTLQVFGEKGGLRWAQEQPNQLYWSRWAAAPDHREAARLASRPIWPTASPASPIGTRRRHAAGGCQHLHRIWPKPSARRSQGRAMDPAANLYPKAEDGLRSMAAVFASG
jgi:predicted dehydrogenase